MKLGKLTIHNIASLADAELDFTSRPLLDASLFLIDGVTGSGKTTILDSICLALYGTTPRMDEANKEEVRFAPAASGSLPKDGGDTLKTNDTKQLLRRGAVEGFVELSFTGNDGAGYLARWEIKHSYNKIEGKLQAPKQSLLNTDTQDVYAKAELRSRIEQVVGLRFDQFCRTTLLAQGDFTRFLYSKENEKADILEKLTGTGQYARIGRMVYVMFNEVREQYKEQSTRLSIMSCLTDDELQALQRRLKEQEAQQTELKAATDALNLQLSWMRQYEQKTGETAARQKELAGKQAAIQSKAYKDETQLIDDYNQSETARTEVKALWEAQASKQEESAKATQYKSRYFSLMQANEGLKKAIAQREAATGKLAADVEEATKEATALQSSIAAKSREIATLKAKRGQTNLPQLTADKNSLIAQTDHCSRAEYAFRELLTARQAEKDAAATLKAQQDALQEKLSQLERLQQQYETCQKDFQLKDAVYERLSQSVADWAKEARKKLNVGDRCPVCGQEIRTLLHDDDFQSLLSRPEKERNEAKHSLDEAATSLKGLQGNIRDVERQLPQYRSKANDATADRTKKETALTAVCQALPALHDAPTAPADFMALLENIRQAISGRMAEVDAQLAEADRQNKDIEAKNAELVHLQENLRKVERDKDKKEKAQADNAGEIKSLHQTLRSCEDLRSSMAELLAKWHDATGTDIRPVALDRLQSEWTAFATAIAGWRKALNLCRNTISEKEQHIQAFLLAHPAFTRSRIEELAQCSPSLIADLKARHKQTEDDITAAKGAIATLKAQLEQALKEKPAMTDGITVQQTERLLKEKTAMKESADKAVAEIRVRIAKDKEDRDNKAKAEAALKTMKANYNKWKVFNDLFGSKEGTKFKMIAESFILNHLLRLANRYLLQFTDRFTLTCVPGSLVILVHDRYQGDRSFGASTLSGGESFLVSLSLALGLSQLNTSRNAVDTLFIDEGFGTLDGDYLNAVMDALGKLHQIAGRRVGIISHVDILSSLIPVQIEVRKVNPTQSRVALSTNTPTQNSPFHR